MEGKRQAFRGIHILITVGPPATDSVPLRTAMMGSCRNKRAESELPRNAGKRFQAGLQLELHLFPIQACGHHARRSLFRLRFFLAPNT